MRINHNSFTMNLFIRLCRNNDWKNKQTQKQIFHNDEIGENTGEDTLLAKQAKFKPGEDEKQQASSNTDQGPAGENL